MSRAIRVRFHRARLRSRQLRALPLSAAPGRCTRPTWPSNAGSRASSCRSEPGTLCARGMLLTDLTLRLSCAADFADADAASWRAVLDMFDGHGARRATPGSTARRCLARTPASAPHRSTRAIAARTSRSKVDCSTGSAQVTSTRTRRRFHDAHDREYGYAIAGRAVEFVTCRLQAVGARAKSRR